MTTRLTAQLLNEMTSPELQQLLHDVYSAQLQLLHEMTAPSNYPDASSDHASCPYNMHSDDGLDYLTAALDLAHELHELYFTDATDDAIRNYFSSLLTKNDEDSPRLWNDYACDGISSLLAQLIPDIDI